MATEELDVVVRGGTVVTAGSRSRCDVGIADGRVVRLGSSLRGVREVDADGCYVLPGLVDMHVHLNAVAPTRTDEPQFVDDFAAGSRAAAAGGVTTYGAMSFPDDGQTLTQAVQRDAAAAGSQSVVDYVLHPGTFTATAETVDEVPELAAAGHLSLKVVTLAFDHDPRHIVDAVAAAGRAGMLTYVHCEDQALIDYVGEHLRATGRGGMEHYPLSRPDFTEAVAVERAIAISEATGAPIVIVHLSSAAALAAARRARERGLPVFVETRPMYLHLTSQVHAQAGSGRFVGMPPAREQADQSALWRGIVDGSVHTIGSDHAPFFLEHKTDPVLDVVSSRKGVAELETMLPLLWSDGVAGGRLSIERLVAVTSTNPAVLNGLYPRKGTIAVGSDADLVVLDPHVAWTVDGAAMQSRAGYSIYDGRQVQGRVRATLSRGELVAQDGRVEAVDGRGSWLPRHERGAL